MRIGVSVFQHRVSPRLDRCREVRIFEIGNGSPVPPSCLESLHWKDESISQRAQTLSDKGVEGFVCGATEYWMEEQFKARGIQIHSWVSGSLEEVLQALTENAPLPAFSGPAPG